MRIPTCCNYMRAWHPKGLKLSTIAPPFIYKNLVLLSRKALVMVNRFFNTEGPVESIERCHNVAVGFGRLLFHEFEACFAEYLSGFYNCIPTLTSSCEKRSHPIVCCFHQGSNWKVSDALKHPVHRLHKIRIHVPPSLPVVV